ncbi:hypothetical protein CAAN1_10S02014 [[Candida] anglica]|uniref:GSKIP domain-containing protein n=1 Tax=[Candida] anglica TaxID=148631 RepID=A0ABP0EEC1_9ASCO
MDKTTQIEELETLYNEYKPFFPSCDLHLNSTKNTNQVPGSNNTIYDKLLQKKLNNYIQIIIKEGETIQVSVDIKGWYVLDKPQGHYETFEALLSEISPGFRDTFGNSLAMKLMQLQDN